MGDRLETSTHSPNSHIQCSLLMLPLLVFGGSSAQAACPPSAEIAVVKGTDVGGELFHDIYIMKLDGTIGDRLSRGALETPPYDEGSPAFSPDSSRVVFSGTRWDRTNKENTENFTMGSSDQDGNSEGDDRTRVTREASYDEDPDWSSTDRIVWVSSRDNEAFEIYTMLSDGTGINRLTFNAEDDLAPRWSPTADRIAFSRGSGPNQQIVVIRVADLNELPLTKTDVNQSPSWLPNGQQLIFSSNRYTATYMAIVRMDAADTDANGEGDNMVQISDSANSGNDAAPAVAADGCIGFIRMVGALGQLFVMQPDGAGLTAVPNASDVVDFAWKP